MSDYGNPDLYRVPRYTSEVAAALRDSADSAMWDDWDLAGLLTDVPNAYAAKIGVSHGIFCASGTAGLHSSLMALELLPGDEVIAPCMTFIRSVTPLVHVGLVPVLADLDPATGNIAPASIEELAGPKTRAVIVVHMWGVAADMDPIVDVCRRKGLLLIEDFSHAHFSRYKDRVVGSFGDVAYASMQRKKTFSVGEGGLIVTKHADVYSRLQQITSPGSFKGTAGFNEFSGFGLNLRMSPFSSVVARCLFGSADRIVADRAAHIAEFTRLLGAFPEHIRPPQIPAYAGLVSAYGYKPAISERDALQALIAGNAKGRWLFGAFNYDSILSSPFWRKSRAHYPFALQISPRALAAYPGYEAYLKGRISLSVPTVPRSYWTDEIRAEWARDLAQLFAA